MARMGERRPVTGKTPPIEPKRQDESLTAIQLHLLYELGLCESGPTGGALPTPKQFPRSQPGRTFRPFPYGPRPPCYGIRRAQICGYQEFLKSQGAGAQPDHAVTVDDSQSLQPLDEALFAELPTFELFFKTFGFKRVHGRIWGLLVLSERPLSSKEISTQLGISQAATSTTLNELTEWGAVRSTFDSSRRCHLHAPVGNAISIVATVFRRREQVVFQQFKQTAERSLGFISKSYGERDPRVVTLRSIITTCDIAEALMQLVFSAVQNAMSDSESVLSRAIHAAFKVGVGTPAKWLFGANGTSSVLDQIEEIKELEPRPRIAHPDSEAPDETAAPSDEPIVAAREDHRG